MHKGVTLHRSVYCTCALCKFLPCVSINSYGCAIINYNMDWDEVLPECVSHEGWWISDLSSSGFNILRQLTDEWEKEQQLPTNFEPPTSEYNETTEPNPSGVNDGAKDVTNNEEIAFSEQLEVFSISDVDLRNVSIHLDERKCVLCDYKGITKSRLDKHFLKKHTINEKQYKCCLCNYRTTQSNALKDHMRTHVGEKRFPCRLCDFKALKKRQLSRHTKTHTGKKPFACTMCDYKVIQESNLKRHMRIHTGEKPFACTVCNYKAAEKSYLDQHVRRRHTGEKPHACTECGYKCAQKQVLKQHMRMHTGEKPLLCILCGHSSAYKDNFRLHMKKHLRNKKPVRVGYVPIRPKIDIAANNTNE